MNMDDKLLMLDIPGIAIYTDTMLVIYTDRHPQQKPGKNVFFVETLIWLSKTHFCTLYIMII